MGGARYEDTIDQGQGLLRTNSTTPTTLAAAQSSYLARGFARHLSSTAASIPALNATVDITSDTLFRLAFGRTLFRPDFNNIIPGVTLPTGGTGTITLNNTQLAPWTADNYNAILEHYFENSAGVISVGAFQRNIKNFFATITQPLTPAFESQYDIDPAVYGGDNVPMRRSEQREQRQDSGVPLRVQAVAQFPAGVGPRHPILHQRHDPTPDRPGLHSLLRRLHPDELPEFHQQNLLHRIHLLSPDFSPCG